MEFDLMQLIGSLGFPIAACCAMFYYLQKEQAAHKEEMQLMTEALNRNTDILIELKTIINMLMGRKQNAGNQTAEPVQRS